MTNDSANEKLPPPKRRGGKVTARTREGLEAALNGKTPRERGAEKAAQALRWLYQWGWSSSSVIAALAGTGKNSALGSRLVKNGWAKKQPIRIVSSYRATPTDLLTITPEGVAELCALDGELPWSRTSAIGKRIFKKNVIHDLLVQTLTLRYMDRWPGDVPEEFREYFGLVTNFTTAHQLGDVERGGKIPDAIWDLENGSRLAIEVELSPKFGRELDQFIARHVVMQTGRENDVTGLVGFFSSQSTADRYKHAMRLGSTIHQWLWDSNRREWYKPREGSTMSIEKGFYFYPTLI